jgi:hypothetical protein
VIQPERRENLTMFEQPGWLRELPPDVTDGSAEIGALR